MFKSKRSGGVLGVVYGAITKIWKKCKNMEKRLKTKGAAALLLLLLITRQDQDLRRSPRPVRSSSCTFEYIAGP